MGFRPKVLVNENDPDLSELIASTLRLMGTDPCCVVCRAEGASLIETQKFDGAFLDWDNDPLDCEQLILLIRHSRSNAKIPIAIISAQAVKTQVAKGFAAGASFFLAKPFGASELERLVNVCRGTMLEERRRYQRVPLVVPMLCQWGQKRGQRRVAGRSANISNTGLLMELSPQPEPGTSVLIELKLPGQQTDLFLKGIVARITPPKQVAVQFIQLANAARELLESFVITRPTSALFPAV
ncbi:MAG TPA: PilZ domain-containing protein [Terriglobia bacterium]|nr:PilZ domain-containing protein [Terriglobia bacterium]